MSSFSPYYVYIYIYTVIIYICVYVYISTRGGVELESEQLVSYLFYNPFNNFFRRKTQRNGPACTTEQIPPSQPPRAF